MAGLGSSDAPEPFPIENFDFSLSRRAPKDEDLTAMYLTDKKNDIIRSRDDHEDLEVLLESFAKQVEEIVNEADTMAVSTLPTPSRRL